MLGWMARELRTRRSGRSRASVVHGALVAVMAFTACTGDIESAEGVKGTAPGGGGQPGQGGSSVFAGSSNCPGYVCYDCASGKVVPASCETGKLCPEGYVADCTPSGGTSGAGGSAGTGGGSGTGGAAGKAGAMGASGSAGANGSAGQADASSGGSAGMAGGGAGGRDSGSSGGGSGAPADASGG
jgi:hypothetical protein